MPTHHQDRWFKILKRHRQPLRNWIAARVFDAVEAVHLDDPPGSVTACEHGLAEVRELDERRRHVHLPTACPDLEVIEVFVWFGVFEGHVADAVLRERTINSLTHTKCCLFCTCGWRMRELDRHPLLETFGEVLALPMRLPLTERCERTIGHVALRLTMTNQAHVDHRRVTLAKRIRILKLSRRDVVARKLFSPIARGTIVAAQFGKRFEGLTFASTGHERRLGQQVCVDARGRFSACPFNLHSTRFVRCEIQRSVVAGRVRGHYSVPHVWMLTNDCTTLFS